MKSGIKLVVCTSLIAIAVTLATFTIADFGGGRAAAEGAPYLLWESGGNVAAFAADDLKHPVTVTEIRLSSLREADRGLIADGLPVNSQEELAQLLEDLGS
ncbi:MAG: hypothetical protein LUB58_02935 [Oscillospiraceae bacterium]|nr:hypothetical protein [Oscillospiraceae bacterium]